MSARKMTVEMKQEGDIELDMILGEVRKIIGGGIFVADFGVWTSGDI